MYCLQNKNKHFHSQKGADLEMIVILNPISRFNLHLPHSLSFFFSPELSLSYYFAAECIICFIYFIYKKMWKCCYTFLMSSHEDSLFSKFYQRKRESSIQRPLPSERNLSYFLISLPCYRFVLKGSKEQRCNPSPSFPWNYLSSHGGAYWQHI